MTTERKKRTAVKRIFHSGPQWFTVAKFFNQEYFIQKSKNEFHSKKMHD
jgi:hypothetical protein